MKKVLLIDGHNLLFRMFFGIPSPIIHKELDVRGIIGFLSSIKRYISDLKPDYIKIVFDSETSTNFNKSLDKNYKQNRIDYSFVEDNKNPFLALPLLYRILTHFQIDFIEAKFNEADDYIASYINDANFEFVIISTDSDFYQLIDSNVSLFVPKGKNGSLIDSDFLYQKLNIYPNQYVEYKALVGDKADNICGVKGIGPKTASFILESGSIDAFLLIDHKFKSILTENIDLIHCNKKLIQLNCYLPLKKEYLPLNTQILKMNVMDIIRSASENVLS